jgi:hypothetical protein
MFDLLRTAVNPNISSEQGPRCIGAATPLTGHQTIRCATVAVTATGEENHYNTLPQLQIVDILTKLLNSSGSFVTEQHWERAQPIAVHY